MYGQTRYLFEGTSVYDFIRQIQNRAMDQLKAQNEDVILNTSTEDLVAGVLNACAVDIPVLRDGETWQEENEVLKETSFRGYDVYTDQHGGTRSVTAHVITLHVPFDGDGSLFTIEPTDRTYPGPAATVSGQELTISITTDQQTTEQVQRVYVSQIQSIKRHLSNLTNDLRTIASQPEAPARNYIEQRKAQLLRNKTLVASLGFPMKRRVDAPTTYRVSEIRRKLTPTKPTVVTAFKPEPALYEADYRYTLKVIANMAIMIERSPHTFAKLREEEIRDHFLLALNSHYEGSATGETFNFQGKTDILIRSDNKNIFIAECKFWHGEKGFLATVDQLLSYLSWRDSKTAVVIFNKNRNLSGVIATIKQAMEKHPHKKRGPTIEGETRFRYVMANPGDHNREIFMTVMVYDIPIPA